MKFTNAKDNTLFENKIVNNYTTGLEKAIEIEKGPALPLKDVKDQVTLNTPLMFAAMENKITTMERMIELG